MKHREEIIIEAFVKAHSGNRFELMYSKENFDVAMTAALLVCKEGNDNAVFDYNDLYAEYLNSLLCDDAYKAHANGLKWNNIFATPSKL